jgi:hypothetical protein
MEVTRDVGRERRGVHNRGDQDVGKHGRACCGAQMDSGLRGLHRGVTGEFHGAVGGAEVLYIAPSQWGVPNGHGQNLGARVI